MVTVEEYRLDKDSMGEVKVPSSAYYGAETQRAVQNFPISGLRLPKEFIRAMALIKLSAARANMQLGLLDPKKGEAIVSAAKEFEDVVKAGRTHLQDAVPMTLGQEFSGYTSMIRHGVKRAEQARDILMELPLGGTAVGTGLNAHPRYAELAIAEINRLTGLSFRKAENTFEAMQSKDACVEASGDLKTIATSLMKISNDLRLLNSGPRTALGEIDLPAMEPGSSIMPGKVNPVIPEAV